MKNFAPRPRVDYRSADSSSPANYLTKDHEWNLVWLAFPILDEFLENKHFVLPDGFPKEVGSNMSIFLQSKELIKATALGPLGFVEAVRTDPNFHLFHPARQRGREWMDTMWARAAMAEGLSVYEGDNVIPVDFKGRRRFG